MRVKSLFVAALCAVAVAAVGVGSAFAGEVTGKGEPTAAPAHAQSICAFSGQNDGEPPPGRTAEHVQNWGQIPKEVRDVLTTEGSHPGDACNGHTGFLAGGGGE
jgi:hypothetical protein